ncbi:MAG: NAD(P)H-hydrate dehydratase [Candidatus Gastranaerophilales bacterium]|nr:NAD(P)H-hydrate dehydratase [Candidatus Gastranaerophilales bacterium]
MASSHSADIQVLGKEVILNMLPKRVQNSHKGTYGHVLNIAGSSQYQGAAYLSSLSALKVGAGHCMLASCSDVINTVASKTPDVTYLDLGQSTYGTIPKDAIKFISAIANYDVVSIGCGLNLIGGVNEFVLNFLKKNKNSYTPIIIDADAINACAQAKAFNFPLNSIITPHPMELSRLMGVDVQEIQMNRAKWAWEASKEYDCIVLLKGHETVIAVPSGKIFINHTGNSSLAKAGSGDILTGMIAGFCAQGISLETSACCATFLHGLAAEIASKSLTEYCVLASDLIKYIPFALKAVLSPN